MQEEEAPYDALNDILKGIDWNDDLARDAITTQLKFVIARQRQED